MRSGWCSPTAAGWSHARCHLTGCACMCHEHVDAEPLLWMGDQA